MLRLRCTRATGMLFGMVLCALAITAQAAPPQAGPANPRVTMVIEKRGTVVLELFPKEAPKTVAHFLDLVNQKFYDGILFHRVIKGFVAQAGDPKSKKVDGSKLADISDQEVAEKYQLGDGGSGTTVPLEVSHPHERGTLGLARSQDPNSGDSQFFINFVANHRLDSGYCVFGKVVKGMNVVDKIRQGDRIKTLRVAGSGEKTKK